MRMAKAKKKTLKVVDLVDQANLQLLTDTVLFKDPNKGKSYWDMTKFIMMRNDVYDGFNSITDIQTLNKILDHSELCQVEKELIIIYWYDNIERISDMWYKTGNIVKDIRNTDMYTKWLQWSFNHFQEANLIHLY
jgi:hypothetical protein